MKDLERIINETIAERMEVEKKQEELAEKIIEAAITLFADISVGEVWIRIDDKKKLIEVNSHQGVLAKFSDLRYGEIVFDNIKKVLSSENSKIDSLIKEYFDIEIPSDFGDIIITLI